MKKILRDSEGSLTLEATIVFPVFLALLLLLINLVNISLTYIAMDHAVSETVKQIAVQAYPLRKIKGETTNIAVKALTKVAIMAKIKELYSLTDVAERDLKITEFIMYNPNSMPEDKDIAVTVEYKIKFLVPFLPLQEIVLSNTAVERAWVDE